MRLGRRRGALRLRLDAVEVATLARLIDELDAVVAEGAAQDPVHERLFPAGYGDATDEEREASAEFQDLTETSLRELKLDRSGQCRAELVAAGGTGGPVDLSLDADAATRWLTVLNDLRLSLGVRLDVREDDEHRVRPDDPDAELRMIYLWLTAVQDRMVAELSDL